MSPMIEQTPEALAQWMTSHGEKPFRAKQLFQWIHQKGAANYAQMHNLPKDLIRKLEEEGPLLPLEVVLHSTSEHDGTEKVLFRLADGELIETVIMRYCYGISLCLSTQVGCRMGCAFCASTIGGLKRNVTAGELLAQVYACNQLTGEKANHVVLMGSGEPLENLDAVLSFIRMIHREDGYHMSIRNMTLSTCGLVNGIRRLAQEHLPLTLAISLHGATDEVRDRLMPINRRYPIQAVLDAVEEYIAATNRRVTFEYAMIDGLNDTTEQARHLARLMRGKLVHVNLIPINAVEENDFRPSSDQQIAHFKSILEKSGINVTIRRELGSDINAACGQLRNQADPTKVTLIRKF